MGTTNTFLFDASGLVCNGCKLILIQWGDYSLGEIALLQEGEPTECVHADEIIQAWQKLMRLYRSDLELKGCAFAEYPAIIGDALRAYLNSLDEDESNPELPKWRFLPTGSSDCVAKTTWALTKVSSDHFATACMSGNSGQYIQPAIPIKSFEINGIVHYHYGDTLLGTVPSDTLQESKQPSTSRLDHPFHAVLASMQEDVVQKLPPLLRDPLNTLRNEAEIPWRLTPLRREYDFTEHVLTTS